jgi:chromosomal replication initiation ATPase DnaA
MKSEETKKEELAKVKVEVYRVFKIESKEWDSKSRKPEFVQARIFAWRMLRYKFGWSTPQIGRAFHRDHSTIVKLTSGE